MSLLFPKYSDFRLFYAILLDGLVRGLCQWRPYVAIAPGSSREAVPLVLVLIIRAAPIPLLLPAPREPVMVQHFKLHSDRLIFVVLPSVEDVSYCHDVQIAVARLQTSDA